MLDATPDRAAQAARVAPSAVDAPRPRVLFASYRSHPFVGGQGVYAREITRALIDLGCAVDVISGPPYPELDPRAGLIRLPSLDLFAHENAFAALRARHLARWADLSEWALHNTGAFGEPYAFGARLRSWLKSRPGRYDVIHDNQGLYRTLLSLAGEGAPVAATLHHPITVDLRHALQAEPTRLGRALLRRWHGFVATQARVARALPALLTVSEASKAAAVRDFGVDPERVSVAPNGVDHDVFRPRPEIARDQNLIVAAASSDIPMKGLTVLIAAFSRLAQARPDARLEVVGRLRDGPVRDALNASGAADRVRFRAGLAREELAGLYASAAVVVAPSLFEGFGLPAAEAMACGAAVAASDGGGLPEVVGDAGVVTPAGDADALAAALEALLADPARRAALGARAAIRARTRFCWRAHAEAALEVYARAGLKRASC